MTSYDSKAEIRLQSWQLGLSLAKTPRLGPTGPVLLCLSEFLSKIGTHLLASSDIMEKNRNSLACLRNAGSHSAVTYCNITIRLNTSMSRFRTTWLLQILISHICMFNMDFEKYCMSTLYIWKKFHVHMINFWNVSLPFSNCMSQNCNLHNCMSNMQFEKTLHVHELHVFLMKKRGANSTS